jgi:hypothetical protein
MNKPKTKPKTDSAIPALPFVPPNQGKGGFQMSAPEPTEDTSGEYDPLALLGDDATPAADPDVIPDSPTALAGQILQHNLGGSLGLNLALGQAGAFPNAGVPAGPVRVAPHSHEAGKEYDPLAATDERQPDAPEYDPLTDSSLAAPEFDPLSAPAPDSGPAGIRGFLFPSYGDKLKLPGAAPTDPQSELAPTQGAEPRPAAFPVTQAAPGTVQDVNPPGVRLDPGTQLAGNFLDDAGKALGAGVDIAKRQFGDTYHKLFPAQSGLPQTPQQAQQNLQKSGAFVYKSAIEPVVQVFDLPNSAKNAFLNTYTQYVDRNSGPEVQGTYQTFAKAVAMGWGAAGKNLAANAKAVGPGATQDFQHVPLRQFWGRIAPFMKEVPVLPKDPQGALAAGVQAANAVSGGVAGYGFLVAQERALRQMGFTQAADETAKMLHSLSSGQVGALKEHFIPLDKAADFVTDMATDPLQVVDHAGKWLRVGLLKSMPGLVTAEGLARGAKIEGSLVSKLPPWFHRQVEGVLAARYTRDEIIKAEVQIGKGVRDVTGTVKDIRDTGNRLSPLLGSKTAGRLDKWVFDYADAGSKGSPYASRKELLSAIADELEDPVTKKVPGEVLAEVKRLGDNVANQEQEFGRLMTRTGFMHPETFQALRGSHIRYLYDTGHYSEDGIMRAMSQLAGTAENAAKGGVGAGKKLADVRAIKARALWDRLTQQLNGLEESAIKGHGVGGVLQAKSNGYLEMLDRISQGPFAIKDPYAGLDTAGLTIRDVEDPAKFLPATRMVRGQKTPDLAHIGDTVRYSDASGRNVTGKIEDVIPAADGAPSTFVLSDGTAINQADAAALQGQLEKLDGPYYHPAGEPLPESIRPKKAYPDKNPIRDRVINDTQTNIVLADGTKLPVTGLDAHLEMARKERDIIQTHIDALKARDPADFPAGTPFSRQVSDAQQELAQQDAVIRRLRALKTNGSAAVRDPELITADTVSGRARQQDLLSRIAGVDDKIKVLNKAGSPKTGGVLSGLVRQRKDLVDKLHGQEQALQDLDLELTESKRLNTSQKIVRPLAGQVNAENDIRATQEGMAAQEAKFAIPTDWIKVSGKEWGPLSDHYIPPAMKKIIEQRYGPDLLLRGAKGDPTQEAALKLASRFVGIIKYNKTALNPSTHFNNIFGNGVLAEIGANLHDTSLVSQPWIMKQAGEEIMAGNGRWLNELRANSNVFDNVNDATREIQGIGKEINPLPQTAFQKMAQGAGGAYAAPGHAFQGEEQLFKLSLYIALRKKGLSALDAAKGTQRYLFDYSDVPQMVEVFRKYGISPFLTFPYKATGVLLETVVKKPSLINRYNILEGQARSFFDDDNVKEQYQQLLDGKPYLGKQGAAMLPVGKDEKGRIMFLDLSKKLPLGFGDDQFANPAANAVSSSFPFGAPLGALVNSGVPNPVPNEGPAFVGYNQNPTFPDFPALSPGATPQEQARTQAEELVKTYLPPLLPMSNLGGLNLSPSMRRIENAVAGRAGGRSLFSPVQSAWLATAQSVFGLGLQVRQGPNAPESADLIEQRKDYLQEKDQPYLRDLSEAFNALSGDPKSEQIIRQQFPGVNRMTNLPEIDRLAKAAEDEVKKTAMDFSKSPAERRLKYRNQLRYLFAINRRAAELMQAERDK